MSTAQDYARANADVFRDQLKDFLRIPSISTDPEMVAEMRRAAEWVAADLRRIGLHNVELCATPGHPVVYGDWLEAGDDALTILIYGHYDVQPATLEDGWSSDPFEPVERDGQIYARGSSDDKGQMFAQIKALEALLATEGKLPVNLKVMFEGEEEIGSKHLGAFVKAQAERLRADVCVISDTALYAPGQPGIIHSLRGMTYMEIHVTGPKTDLHSGQYGGTVHNPGQALAEIIAQLHNPDGSIAVPGFYDDVPTLSHDERVEMAKTDWSDEKWRTSTGAPEPWGEAGYTIRERIGARPTLEVNGLLCGFTGEGSKTALPAKAMAKISCRLVVNQNSQKIYELVRDYVKSITPPTVHSEVKLLNQAEPAIVDIHHPTMQAAITAYEEVWGKRPMFLREGGTLPVVVDMQQVLNAPVIMMGFGLDTDGAHGPDEHFTIEHFHKGIDTAIAFLQAAQKSK
jgi:acetylornithine deacetylase/succinyl-diaminopimelate desuccinylase-like protein